MTGIPDEQQPPATTRTSAASILLRVLRWSVMAALFALLVAPVAGPALTGDQWVIVEGASMAPTLEIGDIIVVDPHGPIAVGDIVTARRPDSSFVTHRIIGIESDGSLQLRGDANVVPDPTTVPRDAIVGTVVATITRPWSTIVRAATSLAGRVTLVGSITLLLFAPAFLSRREPPTILAA